LTCQWGKTSGRLDSVDKGDIDVLGYNFDPRDQTFLSFQETSLADSIDRITECARRISKSGCPIDLDDAYSQNPRYAGVKQLVDALWKGKNCVQDWQEALGLFNQEWVKVRSSKITIEEAIAAIHAAGGVAVLAHPSAIRCSRGWIQPVHTYRLVSLGLDGIEIYHPRMNEAARTYFKQLARRYDLLVTGGSDDHGWPQGFPRLGSQPVPAELINEINRRSSNRTAKYLNA
jgi:predicted metal-dependent phosphoesterase TrpH